jgi:hypothetical protein
MLGSCAKLSRRYGTVKCSRKAPAHGRTRTCAARAPLSHDRTWLLLAATGVGAGDLATASFAGGLLGTAVLWAVVFGAFLKFVVTEGLARWQLATGETLIEGAVSRGGRSISRPVP